MLMRATSMIMRTQRPARPNKCRRQVEQSERESYTADTEEDLNATDTADTVELTPIAAILKAMAGADRE